MNVAICVNTLSYAMGGVSTHILDLCKQYAKLDEIKKLIVCCDSGEHIDALKAIPKVQYIEIPFNHNGMSPEGIRKSYKSFWGGICSERINIIHVHSQRILPVAHLIYRLHGIPYLWTNHIDAIPNPRVFKLMCRMMRFPIISVSAQLREMMIQDYGCAPEKCHVVNNGTDLERLTPLSAEEKSVLEEEYRINRREKPYVICLLGRMTYIKGHLFLLQAISKLQEKDKIQVIFAGHTYADAESYKKQLEAFAGEHKIAVGFLDYSAPRDVFGVSDLYVSPSLYEGFSLTCIESLAMECAVIRSRTPGWQEMREWVEIVEKQDIDGLSKQIHQAILNGFNKEKTLAGAKAVRKFFTKENCARNTVEVYKKVIGR